MGTNGKPHSASDGRFAYEGLDRAIHEKARLGILTSLIAQPDGLSFNDLKELCSLTDGNLNRHLAVLEEAHLVVTNRNAKGRRPHTVVAMTANGRKRYQQYLNVLEQILADAASQQRSVASRVKIAPGFSPA